MRLFKTFLQLSIWLRCDPGGVFKPRGHGKRNTSSCQDECPFELIATRDLVLETWSLSIKNSHHNHPPTLAGSYPVHRKMAMTPRVKHTIANQSGIHATAMHILSSLRLEAEGNNPLFKPKDIYNQQADQRMKNLGSLTPIQALVHELHQHESWFVLYTADHTHQIQ